MRKGDGEQRCKSNVEQHSGQDLLEGSSDEDE